MPYANNKGADQPVHPRSLISAFIVRCLDSVMSLVSVTKISSLMLASVAEQAGLCLAWSETPEDTFCRVMAQIFQLNLKSYRCMHMYHELEPSFLLVKIGPHVGALRVWLHSSISYKLSFLTA